MNALDALRVARETGAKVRPCQDRRIRWYTYYDRSTGKKLFQGGGRAIALPEEYLFNPDGSFAEWEIVQEALSKIE